MSHDFTAIRQLIDAAFAAEGLRSAGQQDVLPRGLLARTELRRFRRNSIKAQTDLSEVRELAERSGMRLFLRRAHQTEWQPPPHFATRIFYKKKDSETVD